MHRLIFKSFPSPGDIVLLSAAVRDLHVAYPGRYETDVRTSADAIWEHHLYATPCYRTPATNSGNHRAEQMSGGIDGCYEM